MEKKYRLMINMVLKNGKTDWKLYWKENGEKAWMFCFAAVIYGTIAWQAQRQGEELNFCMYASGMFLILGLQEIFPNRLSKWMFVIPMGETEKKEYLYTQFGLKMGVAFLIGMVMWLIDCISGRPFVNQIFMWVFWSIFSVLIHIDNRVINKDSMKIGLGQGLCICIFFCGNMLFAFSEKWNVVISLICTVIMGIVGVILIRKHWRNVFLRAMDYEYWNIQGARAGKKR